MIKRLVQYFDDDLLGAVRFIDRYAYRNTRKAQAKHIRLDKVIPECERKRLRQEIAADINQRGNPI